MGLFIDIQIDQSKFAGLRERELCARVCPVDALKATEASLDVVAENEDECTFCDLCVQNAPAGAVRIVRTYEPWLAKP